MSQAEFMSNMCVALDQTSCTDNLKRMQAETFIQTVSSSPFHRTRHIAIFSDCLDNMVFAQL
jgi:hypothetical protein